MARGVPNTNEVVPELKPYGDDVKFCPVLVNSVGAGRPRRAEDSATDKGANLDIGGRTRVFE